jgi:hypothetical protein
MGLVFQPMHLLVLCVVYGVVGPMFAGSLLVLPCWKIFSKAGFPGPLALLMLVPVVGLLALYVVAFLRWRPGGGVVGRRTPYGSAVSAAPPMG